MNDNKIGYKDKKYFNNLDFFRIIFTFVLVLFHLSELVKTPNWVPRGGHYVAVEFFFMLSGFLLFFENVELGTFIKKRWIRLAPVVLFQVYLMDFFIYGNPRTDMLLGAFFLDVGIRHNFYVSWFVPVLFWSSVFYFFLKNLKPSNIYPLVMLVVYISYCFVLNSNNYSLDAHRKNIFYILNLGMLRGLGGTGLGFLLAALYSKIKSSNTRFNFFFFSFAEIFILYLVLNRFFLKPAISHLTDLNMIFVFACLIVLFAVNFGFISRMLNKIPCRFLAQFCFSIYVMQYVSFKIAKILYNHLNKFEFIKNHQGFYEFYFALFMSVFCGVLTFYIIERPSYKFLFKKIKKQL